MFAWATQEANDLTVRGDDAPQSERVVRRKRGPSLEEKR